ncbi:TnsA endonuclease N-terminal domain-containing protein [Rugamonas apoptosis]|uniref:TnsA endonuclease N-terminal domain-containing protein n=1 Tax=Rugamonas apoptosis TaxID=2758570 RepID=A0A7W2F741_9BURK|nr:TnsA endonuclease N-terminal domain-containing protein [Rugamonas apoptosis]MBA5686315.1 TnsA endonuclease N-terminal domain-containing protein [Rugamonas apoptosis]
MPVRKYVLTEKKIQERLAAGWGQLDAEEYHPFLRITDISSKGRVHLIANHRLGRQLHFLSDLEWYNYLVRLREKNAIDFREQVALSRDVTRAIAAELGVEHPRDNQSDAHTMVMTTDLVVTYMGPRGPYHVAYFVKYKNDLENNRVKEKLAIERRYWEEQGIELVEFTEADISEKLKRSLLWLSTHETLRFHSEPFPNYFKNLGDSIVAGLPNAPADMPFTKYMQELDRLGGLKLGEHLLVARHLLAKSVLSTDFEVDSVWFAPTGSFNVNTNEFEIE